MTPKEKRTISVDLRTLFSKPAFLNPKTTDEWKSVGPFHPTVRFGANRHPLSGAGSAALSRITDIMQRESDLRKSCSASEIAEQISAGYEGWLERLSKPDANEFVEGCRRSLMETIKNRIHMVVLKGLELKDLDHLDLGAISIHKPDIRLLAAVQFGDVITKEWIERDFSKGLWLIGKTLGSREVSLQRFNHNSRLVIGILAVCGAISYDGSIWKSYIRPGLSPHKQAMPTSILSWDEETGDPTISNLWGKDQNLPFDAERICYLREHCFLDRLGALLSRDDKSEVERFIERALYWFADAHGDRNTTMRFVKLWSCVEGFFAFQETDITEANARGMATILTFAGHSVWKVEDYQQYKKRLKELYDLRSRAVHRAEFDGIQLNDLRDLSQWVAWVVISMTALAERGYLTLAQIKKQTDRLDALTQLKAPKGREIAE